MTDIFAQANDRLTAIEAEHGVSVLVAVESGSRAWGFASPDSDYDVRFIYVRPRDWYLAIDVERQRDVIETPIEGPWDVNGWDLRKALWLFRKSNPPLFEWVQSPLVYREVGPLASRMRALLGQFYNPVAQTHHYLHMARGNYREYLQASTVWRKKYFYVLRPVLAVRWIEQDRGVVPTEFEKVLVTLDDEQEVLDAILKLLEEKRANLEMGRGAHVPVLNRFVEAELLRHEQKGVGHFQMPEGSTQVLNRLFREMLP